MDKILVTRPEIDFQATSHKLSALGYEALSAPMMHFSKINFTQPNLDDYSALIFTSANGIRAINNHPEFTNLPCYAVGDTTAKMAANKGLTVLAQGGGNVESLVNSIEKNYLERGLTKPLLHISGVHQAGNLAQKLAEISIETKRIQAYEMLEKTDMPDQVKQAIKDKTISALLFYSARSAKIFFKNIQKFELLHDISKITAFCLSKNIAEAVAKPYLEHIYYTDQPNETALLKLMHQKLKIDPLKY